MSRFTHHGAVTHSHPSCISGSAPGDGSWVSPQHLEYRGRPPGSAVSTTGSLLMPTTRSLFATSYTFQSVSSLSGAGPTAAMGGLCGMSFTSVSCLFALASFCSSGVHAM